MPNLLPQRTDPYNRYNFYVEWDGIIHAGFMECSGLDSSQNPGEYREGTDPLTSRKIPGLVSYSNISLQRGVTYNKELWDWRSALASGNTLRKEISIVLLDDQGTERIRWNLTNCWPTSWSGPDLSASADDAAVESIELAHEGIVKYEVTK